MSKSGADMAAAAAAAAPVQLVKDYEGRGRALIASRAIMPGEVILSDSPILLYAATVGATLRYCSQCFRKLPPSCFPCPRPFCADAGGDAARFCSERCRTVALSSSHVPWVCESLARIRSLPPPDDPDLITQAYFLIAAYALAAASPADFHRLLSLHGDAGAGGSSASYSALHSLLASLSPPPSPFGFSPDLTAALLTKDKLNAFGIMAEADIGDPTAERKVRAYGIYPQASFFNHDCLPNACRFDYVDSGCGTHPTENNTSIVIRAIHEISQGNEVCLSYFPVKWSYAERQKRLLEDYGFLCRCERCEIEKSWKDEGEGDDMEDEQEEGMAWGDESNEDDSMDNEDGDDFPHAFFFVKFVCRHENCGGTLAPLPPSPRGQVSDMLECNVCGRLTKDEEDDDAEQGDNGLMLDD